MTDQLEVCAYSIEKLRGLIAKFSNNHEDVIKEKLHHQYFEGYCNGIRVKTIVAEHDYIDHDYLEDFSAYYVRCFSPYQRTCARLHFFGIEFSREDLGQFLTCHHDTTISSDKLKSAYLGFVVIKPLPQTVIGRTCLKTYPSENRRHFPIVRRYKVNLFGIELIVKSLAFQEQDKVVAACATSALWSVFQGTGKHFQHTIPSPVEITRAATERHPTETRALPTRGLSVAMMAHAIRNIGLEPYYINVSDGHVLKSTAYAYLRGCLPMILGIELWDMSNYSSKGFHAVAATGFSLRHDSPTPVENTSFFLKASRVDKLYVHDDQVGPFARMNFDEVKIIKPGDKELPLSSLSTSWPDSNGKIGGARALPTILLIPLYHKIRIPYDVIHDAVMSFNGCIESLRVEIYADLDEHIEWDIYLTTGNSLKAEIQKSKFVTGKYCRHLLLEGMPRFLWRATAFHMNTPLIDLIFDATDIEQGSLFIRAIEYDETLSTILRGVGRSGEIENIFPSATDRKIIQWLMDHPEPTE